LSPYAITKAVSEQYLAFYHHQYSLDYTVLRYANVYGPRQIPHGEAGVVAIFMDRLLNDQPCTVYHFANELRGMTRDYCFVGDVVQANLLALAKGSGEAFNIGTTVATHTADLFEAIYAAVKEVKPELEGALRVPVKGAARAGDLTQSCLNVDKAKQILGFVASHDLMAGLRKTLQWRLAI
jgi:UDP-glucose 4-epimerase